MFVSTVVVLCRQVKLLTIAFSVPTMVGILMEMAYVSAFRHWEKRRKFQKEPKHSKMQQEIEKLQRDIIILMENTWRIQNSNDIPECLDNCGGANAPSPEYDINGFCDWFMNLDSYCSSDCDYYCLNCFMMFHSVVYCFFQKKKCFCYCFVVFVYCFYCVSLFFELSFFLVFFFNRLFVF